MHHPPVSSQRRVGVAIGVTEHHGRRRQLIARINLQEVWELDIVGLTVGGLAPMEDGPRPVRVEPIHLESVRHGLAEFGRIGILIDSLRLYQKSSSRHTSTLTSCGRRKKAKPVD